jgi:hypothetical protein
MAPQILTTCGIAALIISAASTILILLVAIALLNLRSSIWPLAIVAAVLDIFTLAWVAYMLASSMGSEQYGRRRKSLGTIRLILSMLLCSVAALVTLGSLVWIQLRPASATGTFFGNSLFTLQKCEYGLLGAAVVMQAVFTGIWTRNHDMVRLSSSSGDMNDAPQQPEMQSPQGLQHFTPPMQLQPVSQRADGRRSLASASSHSVSSASLKAPSSRRSSVNEGVRPMTSRSRLVRPHSWTPSSSTVPDVPLSSRRAAHASTSATGVAGWLRKDSVTTQSTTRSRASSDASHYSHLERPETPLRTRLETIPGSRANSPARPLDGPFPGHSDSTKHEPAENMPRTTLPAPGEQDEEALVPRPTLERFVTAPMSPQIQPTKDDESNIHPLFRSASPEPPPTTTRGTVITGAQEGGQYMTPKTLQRATSRRRVRMSLYDPNRARSHSQLRAKARQQHQQLPIPHTIVRARSLETLDSWQTRLEEGEHQLTQQQRALAASLGIPSTQLGDAENAPMPSKEIPNVLKVQLPKSRSSSTNRSNPGTPRRALGETCSNTPQRSSTRRGSPRNSRDAQRSSLSMKQRRSGSARPDIIVYVDPAES